MLQTERLILRPWKETDAESLYEYAKDPAVGPIAGWKPHESVADSLWVIRNVLSAEETYAVCLKETGKAIGSIGLIAPTAAHMKILSSEREIGYWIGVPFWGKGLIPEATRALLRHAFEDLGVTAVWCGFYDGNERSRRAAEKCGFCFHHTEEDKPCVPFGENRTEHYCYLTKERFENGVR